MKNIQVLHFDAFTSTPGKGNPAGIVLSTEDLSAREMQAVAADTGFGDTAFVSPSVVADFRIRYFSPRREIALCGHATIAVSIALDALDTRGVQGNGSPLPCAAFLLRQLPESCQSCWTMVKAEN